MTPVEARSRARRPTRRPQPGDQRDGLRAAVGEHDPRRVHARSRWRERGCAVVVGVAVERVEAARAGPAVGRERVEAGRQVEHSRTVEPSAAAAGRRRRRGGRACGTGHRRRPATVAAGADRPSAHEQQSSPASATPTAAGDVGGDGSWPRARAWAGPRPVAVALRAAEPKPERAGERGLGDAGVGRRMRGRVVADGARRARRRGRAGPPPCTSPASSRAGIEAGQVVDAGAAHRTARSDRCGDRPWRPSC